MFTNSFDTSYDYEFETIEEAKEAAISYYKTIPWWYRVFVTYKFHFADQKEFTVTREGHKARNFKY
jgi:hypothetical protein